MRSFLLVLLSTPALAGPSVDPPVVPAAGAHHVVLQVPEAGRYAITVKSLAGVALQLQDRALGIIGRDGSAGRSDGRMDLFLDAGEYRLLLDGGRAAGGEARPAVRPFTDAGPDDERLVPHALATGPLADLQARGWWIHVPERERVSLEAIGRHLADLRLWRGGQWLEDARPACARREVVRGQPRTWCTLTPILEPGLYRLVAYGGPGLPWTDDAEGGASVHVRRGVQTLAEAGVRHHRISPFGVDRFRAPAGAHLVRWSLPEVKVATLRVAGWREASPFAMDGSRAALVSNSRRPELEVQVSLSDALITLEGTPGQAGVLRWIQRPESSATLQTPGRWFVAGVPMATGDDLPSTAVLTHPVQRHDRPMGDAVILLDRPRQGAFNLAGEAHLFVRIPSAGAWRMALTGGRLRVQPWWTRPPKPETPPGFHTPIYSPPPFEPVVEASLAAGLYRITLMPDTAGVVTLEMKPGGLRGWVSDGPQPLGAPLLQWPQVEVGAGAPVTVHGSKGRAIGWVARPLPLELERGVPVWISPEEHLALPVKTSAGVIEARTPDGGRLPISFDGMRWGETLEAEPGEGAVMLRNPGEAPVLVDLRLRPAAVAGGPLPRLTDALRAELPRFPVLRADRPVGLDLAAEGLSTWRVEVPAPGLYAMESTGLLATRGVVRTRTRTALAKDDGAGTGRNFAVARYLSAGEYQLSVSTRGASAGHLGLRLRRTALIDAGALASDAAARLRLPAGRAAAYGFTVAAAGRFRLTSVGREATFRCRVEDADGWPVGDPEARCDRTMSLEPGAYRVLLSPARVETLRHTRLEALRPATRFEGPGPHALPFGEEVEHVWREPADPARPPHTWTFTMPAAAPASLSLAETMVADLKGPDGAQIARIGPGRTWEGPLTAGPHTLEVRAAWRDDGARYQITLSSPALLPGTAHVIYTPATLNMAVGEPGLYTLSTQGGTDVRLTVREGAAVIGENDDGPGDWNAHLTLRLKPGEYAVEARSLQGSGGSMVRLHRERPETAEALRLGGTAELIPGAAGLVVPLEGRAAVVVAALRGAEGIGLALERQGSDGWQILAEAVGPRAEVAARPAEGEALRVRVWSLGAAGAPVTLRAAGLTAQRPGEGAWARGLRVDGRPWSAVTPRLRAGVFTQLRAPAGVLLCPTVGAGCAPPQGATLGLGGDEIWILGPGRFAGRRLVLGRAPSPSIPVGTRPVLVDLPPGAGPRFVEAQAATGQPGVAIGDGPTGWAERRALAVALEGGRQARLWSADGAPLQVRARAGVLEPGAPTGDTLAPGQLVERPLASTNGRLVLGPGAAARIGGHLLWAATRALVVELPAGAEAMTLVNVGAAATPFGVEEAPGEAPAAAPPLVPGAPYTRLPARAGAARVSVAAHATGVLRLRGATGRYARGDGRVFPADGAPVGPGGVVELEHHRAPTLLWVATAEAPGPHRLAPVEAASPLTGPALRRIALPHRFEVSAPAGRLLSLRAPRGVVLQATAVKGITEVSAEGLLDLWLPTGRATVVAYRLDGPGQGEIHADLLAPVDLGEGVGPQHLFAPGQTRVYRVQTRRAGEVGVGIRGAVDRLEARLLDPRGAVIASGHALMPDLAAGEWLLTLRLPADAPPAMAQPVVLGLAAPGDGPPADVLRTYLPANSKVVDR